MERPFRRQRFFTKYNTFSTVRFANSASSLNALNLRMGEEDINIDSSIDVIESAPMKGFFNSMGIRRHSVMTRFSVSLSVEAPSSRLSISEQLITPLLSILRFRIFIPI